MSSSAQLTGVAPAPLSQPAVRARFLGIMYGEFLKVRRLFWGMVGILAAGFVFAFLIGASSPRAKANLQHTPLTFMYSSMESNLMVFRFLICVLVIILTSLLIGRAYQSGGIRVLLARGVGRVQLLLAQLALVGLLALALLAAFTLFSVALTGLLMLMLVGNLNAFSALTPAFWPNIGIEALCVVVSMVATILMAATMNALGRSLTFGLSASLIWFPIDNLGTFVLSVLARLTQSDFWTTITAYLLGPLLNRLPDYVLPTEAQSPLQSFGPPPLVPVDSAHAFWVIGVYSLFFFILALVPTWKRDVKE